MARLWNESSSAVVVHAPVDLYHYRAQWVREWDDLITRSAHSKNTGFCNSLFPVLLCAPPGAPPPGAHLPPVSRFSEPAHEIKVSDLTPQFEQRRCLSHFGTAGREDQRIWWSTESWWWNYYTLDKNRKLHIPRTARVIGGLDSSDIFCNSDYKHFLS
jgi:hypothetical protein